MIISLIHAYAENLNIILTEYEYPNDLICILDQLVAIKSGYCKI